MLEKHISHPDADAMIQLLKTAMVNPRQTEALLNAAAGRTLQLSDPHSARTVIDPAHAKT